MFAPRSSSFRFGRVPITRDSERGEELDGKGGWGIGSRVQDARVVAILHESSSSPVAPSASRATTQKRGPAASAAAAAAAESPACTDGGADEQKQRTPKVRPSLGRAPREPPKRKQASENSEGKEGGTSHHFTLARKNTRGRGQGEVTRTKKGRGEASPPRPRLARCLCK